MVVTQSCLPYPITFVSEGLIVIHWVAVLGEAGFVHSSRLVHDAAATKLWQDTNSTLLTSSSYGNRFAFQGREWFAELNLTDHRNRYYSPELNRWLNRDSIAEDGGVNLYEYVENNPLNLTDHYGLYYDIVVGVPPPSSPYCLAACVVNGPDHGTSPNPAKLKSCVAKFKAEFRRIIATKGVGAGSQGACQLLDACYLLYGPSGPLY